MMTPSGANSLCRVNPAGGGRPRQRKQENKSDTEFHKVHTKFHREGRLRFARHMRMGPRATARSANKIYSVKLCVHFVKLCVRLTYLAMVDIPPATIQHATPEPQ